MWGAVGGQCDSPPTSLPDGVETQRVATPTAAFSASIPSDALKCSLERSLQPGHSSFVCWRQTAFDSLDGASLPCANTSGMLGNPAGFRALGDTLPTHP